MQNSKSYHRLQSQVAGYYSITRLLWDNMQQYCNRDHPTDVWKTFFETANEYKSDMPFPYIFYVTQSGYATAQKFLNSHGF